MDKTFYIETYGCQMNFADSEILSAILTSASYTPCSHYRQADVILINTCSIRDHAEQRIYNRLREFVAYKKVKPRLKIGIIGCMAERLKEDLLSSQIAVDLVVGPDAYRSLPRLLQEVESGAQGIDVLLSEEETYHDISPVRLGPNKISAFVSIMRGCENYCAYCVVPYTRGKERSRDPQSIIEEARQLFHEGYREITLLGQNVNSYNCESTTFPLLMEAVAQISPLLRVRFSTSHPKDLSDDLLKTMVKYPNICKAIHLPVQSGSSRMLKQMKRKYDRIWYLDRIASIRKHIPDCGLSTDIITGFCGETLTDHQETLSLMREVGYDFAFMFKYSERPNTLAARSYIDDVAEEEKLRRLNEVIDQQQVLSFESNKKDVGKDFEILVEGISKKSKTHYFGRSSQNKVIVFENSQEKPVHIGDYAYIHITQCTAATLLGSLIEINR
ncbi:MAG: tRNA (N6-isopentenyl adenosine(37)-C2)-methylthiotransferase MiaB [Bacteroidales bacterium]